MNRTSSLLFPLALALATALVPQRLWAQEPAAEEMLAGQRLQSFRVGTWNLEFLGAEGNFRNNLPPRGAADLQAIGRKIAELGVCILAVQEINDEGTLKQVAAAAGPQWDAFLGTSGAWTDRPVAQRIGFVYDKNTVDLLFAEELLQLPREFEGESIFHRVPVTAVWKHKPSGCDFRLVTVHLKAGQKPDDKKKRRGEASALSGWLDTLARQANEDPDVVVLGDFNSTYGTEPEQIFEQSGLRKYLDQTSASPTIMHFPEPIDQVVVSDGCVEVRRTSLQVASDFGGLGKDAWRQTYSDHYPVTIQLRCANDDDPQATFWRGGPEQVLPLSQRRPREDGREPGREIGKPIAWPYTQGRRVQLLAGGVSYSGTLVRDLAQDGTGWVMLETDGGLVTVHASQVAALRMR
ncbi:MAG: endonuclease/exonuclease/phosphatase family protein [Planctomycetota bacterium]